MTIGARDMTTTDIAFEMDMKWMRFADLLVDTGVITDTLENRKSQEKPHGGNRVQ
ncbi:MAG: hypothetical protein M0Q91_17045 [Methanoregula sp.]|nr:hypothetical protein [Methanoregula sp.]